MLFFQMNEIQSRIKSLQQQMPQGHPGQWGPHPSMGGQMMGPQYPNDGKEMSPVRLAFIISKVKLCHFKLHYIMPRYIMIHS
jgi:hypothetical protein